MPSCIVHNTDCLEGFADQPDAHFDLCLADPPYGIAYQSARRTGKREWKPKIDNDEKPFTDWIAPVFQKLKMGGRLVCFYRWDVQEEFRSAIEEAGFTIKSQIVWDKVMHGMGDLSGEFAPQHELALYATKGRYEFRGTRPKSVYRCQRVNAEKMIHPNEKPVPLMRAIIRDIALPGEKALVPFAGSFSDVVACEMEGVPCVGFELKKHYFDLGIVRMETALQQVNLF